MQTKLIKLFNHFFSKIDWSEANSIHKSNVYTLYRLSTDYKTSPDNYWSRLSLLEECVWGDKFSDHKTNTHRECGGVSYVTQTCGGVWGWKRVKTNSQQNHTLTQFYVCPLIISQ